MNYDEITKITAERISDYMTEAVNTVFFVCSIYPSNRYILLHQ